MQISRFNYMVQSPVDPKVTFLYNSLTDNRIAVEEVKGESSIEQLFEKIQAKKKLSKEEEETTHSLKELGYLIDDECDEKKVFTEWMQEKVIEQKEVANITILTSMACNLRCTYCFEMGKLSKAKMSDQTAHQIADWLIESISQKPGFRHLNITYFGGEPLLNIEAIRIVGKKLTDYSLKAGFKFTSGAVTNGIFITPKLIDELKEHGLTWLKITFDGDKSAHDQKRIYSDGRGTFEKIFQNLENIAGKIKILIGGNFDHQNSDSFLGLLDKLNQSKFKSDISTTNFKPIMPPMTGSENQGLESSCVRCTYSDEQIRKAINIRQYARKLGFKSNDPVDQGPCDFYERNSVTLGVDGAIYNCPAFVEIKETQIGHVTKKGFNALGENMLMVSKPFETNKCNTCAFPPICGGGCRADSYNTTGSYENISCQQEFFKKNIMSEFVDQFYHQHESTKLYDAF